MMPSGRRRELVQELLERVVDGARAERDGRGRRATATLVTGTVHGHDLGLFIGRHGADDRRGPAPRLPHRPDRGGGERERIVIDAEGYRARREEALQRQADQAARRRASATGARSRSTR